MPLARGGQRRVGAARTSAAPGVLGRVRRAAEKMLDFQVFGFGVRSTGQYEGAAAKRRLKSWQPGEDSMTALLAGDGRMLRRRGRDLMRNNPLINSAGESYTANLIGAGIKPSSMHENTAIRKAINEAWQEWVEEADTAGLADFYGLQSMAARAIFEAGEMFVRFRARRIDDGLTVPLQLELLESEMLPYERNETAPSGNRIINGVEFNLLKKRQAYWFYRQHPGDIKIFGLNTLVVRVPAENVLHVFRPLRPGQVRGVTFMHPSMVRAYLLDQYDDAELDRKKTAAMFAGFIQSAETDVIPETEPGRFDNEQLATLEPGTLQTLLPGEKIEFSAPVDVGGTYENFQYRNLLAMCSGVGVPYMAVTGDITKANYSSLRGGLIEYRRRLESQQFNVMVHQLCRPVWQRWMTDAVISGRLTLPGYADNPRMYWRARWITPRYEWVDPIKDVAA
jgi:lambda family phage portal protein